MSDSPVDYRRAAFEKHFDLSSRQAWKTRDGAGYMNTDIQAKWLGWKAAMDDKRKTNAAG